MLGERWNNESCRLSEWSKFWNVTRFSCFPLRVLSQSIPEPPMSFAARGTTYPLHSQLHLQLVSVNRLAVQLAAISASHVDDDSLVSTAHVREE